ncbi:S1C family serine protease [Paenibacillus sp. OVF10]|nr:S1C family serine protease [Paenibacillus sp. OVF10]
MKGEVIGVNTMGIEKGDLNFAIPIDYASRWIKKYTALSFSSIPVLNQDQFRETAVTEQDPTVEQPSTVSQNVHLMGRTVREATLDPAQSVIFAIDENQSTIFAYRYADNKVLGESTAFSTPQESFCMQMVRSMSSSAMLITVHTALKSSRRTDRCT